jgi:reactive intermediate/imine deaminase
MALPIFHMVPGAPTPVAPYSHLVETEGWLFLTGQLPVDPGDDAAPIPQGIEAQTRRTLENLKIVLAGVGAGLEHVVAARVFLVDFPAHYEPMNRVYASYFRPDALPARTCVGVTHLARGCLVEIDAIARRPPADPDTLPRSTPGARNPTSPPPR